MSKFTFKQKTITEFFEKLEPQKMEKINVMNGGLFAIELTDCGMTVLDECFIITPDGEFPIPSKEGYWHLHQLLGHEIVSIVETEKHLYITADNGTKIDVNLMLEPDSIMFGGKMGYSRTI